MRKITIAIALVVVLVLVASGIFLLQTLTPYDAGYPKVYIRSDGNVEPSTAPINCDGNLYTLQADIEVYKLIVEKSNIILDGNGFSINTVSPFSSRGGPGKGDLEVLNVENVTLRNLDTGYEYQSWSYEISAGIDLKLYSSSFIESVNNKFNCIFITNCHDILVSENDLNTTFNMGGEVQLKNSRDCTISSCPLYIVVMKNSSHNLILNNNMTFLRHHAVELEDSSSNLFFGNQLRLTGPLFEITGSSEKNLFVGNYIQATVGQDPILDCSGANTFYHNNFINVRWNKNLSSTSMIWDNGVEGNHWNNYLGTDSNHNGIGDTPHLIDANNQDKYPLMKRIDLSLEPQPQLPE
jgi:hypothetical protein